jgi:hypothetical protein
VLVLAYSTLTMGTEDDSLLLNQVEAVGRDFVKDRVDDVDANLAKRLKVEPIAVVPHAANAWEHWNKLGAPTMIVAPMVDQSELPFRMLCRKYGATAAYTPMLHSRLFSQDVKYRKEFTTCQVSLLLLYSPLTAAYLHQAFKTCLPVTLLALCEVNNHDNHMHLSLALSDSNCTWKCSILISTYTRSPERAVLLRKCTYVHLKMQVTSISCWVSVGTYPSGSVWRFQCLVPWYSLM